MSKHTALVTSLLLLASPAHAASVKLTWTANPESNLAGYKLYYSTNAGPPYNGTMAAEGPSPVDIPLSALADKDNPQYSLTGIPSCTHLHLALTAYDTSGAESDYSTPVNATIVYKPTAVAAAPGGTSGSLLVSWAGLPAGDTGTLSGYQVHYAPTSGKPYQGTGAEQGSSPVSAGLTATSLLLTGLTDGSMVHVAVESICADGEGNLSDETSGSVAVPVCGNGVVESGEICDPASSCPQTCNDGNACTEDAMTGSASSCDASCSHALLTQCATGDGCCPPGCDNNTDGDCSPSCGNGIVEQGETCDLPSSCPQTCDDGNTCTTDTMTGSAASCSTACSYTTVTECAAGDGCCPPGCDNNTDGDCSPSCGNGVVEQGETCDPPSSCPQTCDDGNVCTTDTLTGGAANCSTACNNNPITTCDPSDGCCPAGCDSLSDRDCSESCGNGIVEQGETCDPPGTCLTSCDDNVACTIDKMTGSKANCNAACSHTAVTACAAGDGCCPPGCDPSSDSDCGATPSGPSGPSGPPPGVTPGVGPATLQGGCGVVGGRGDQAAPALGLLVLLLLLIATRRPRPTNHPTL